MQNGDNANIGGGSGACTGNSFTFQAYQSNSIFGASNTVQTNALQGLMIIKI